ncbi:hypothetical protein EGW08_020265 [Elysia chlorotica]|uniref:PID domain-containing protein n=1 Tax=Elysia chlorotica TaxID=188477 RepID=A0A433SRR9_ELYCH|nr:hypothetical protein EGW08_020265 [Elysia chlorotica]
MTTKAKKDEVDVTRFEGNGLSFKAKLIGIEDVPEARGDQMCQDALIKLKNAVRVSGEHKQKIFVNVTLEGLKIVDAISLAGNQSKKKTDPKGSKSTEDSGDSAQEADGSVLHSHAVHRISFISRDVTDSRAFGYIYGETDETHKFYAIKTASAAEQLVYTIRDLFQAVYDMKKKEMEDAKQKLEQGDLTATSTSADEGNSQTPGNGSTSGTGQTPQANQNAEGENIYQVPPNNAPVAPAAQADQVANLLDLEDQTEHILKGIEQIKNLEFDSITDSLPTSPTSPVSPTSPIVSTATPGAAFADPWGMPATSQPAAPSSSSSALGDLAGLHTSTFPTMPSMMHQPFPGSAFPGQGAFGATPGFGQSTLPVSNDPFGNDPFSMNAHPRPPVSSAAGFPASNPFGGGGFPPQQMYGAQPRGMMPGMPGPAPGVPGVPGVPGAPGAGGIPGVPGFMGQPGFGQPPTVGRAPNPFGMGFAQMPAATPQQQQQQGNLFGEPKEDSNLLQPVRKVDGQKDAAVDKEPKKLKDDLFGDLVDIKKSPGTSSDSPKDLFAKASMVEKKSMNALKAQVGTDSLFDSEPFGPSHPLKGDKTRGLLPSDSEDPFDTSHIPPTLSEPPSSAPPPQPVLVMDNTPPPVPRRPGLTLTKESSKSQLSPAVLLSPPPPSSQPSKRLNSSFSSSSSLSSTSSSTSPSLSSKSHHLSASGKPPPLPKRTPADGASPSKTCDISDVNTPPSSLALSNLPASRKPDLLPSPDEPPPPLPEIPYATSAPPPPPRPNLDFPVSASQSSPSVSSSRGSNKESDIAALPSQATHSDFDVKFDTFDDMFAIRAGQKPEVQLENDAPSEWDSNFSPNSSPKVVPRDPTDPFSPSLSLRKTKAKSRTSISAFSAPADKQVADPFLLPPPSGEKRRQTLKASETPAAAAVPDPFSVPTHLTPGFKVEAKFGNDPFDDSFSEAMHGKPTDSSWDPFGPDLNKSNNVVGTPTTDPFGAPAQPVNGNNNQGSLFD